MKPNPIVLVIDNDKANRRLLRLLLGSQHYRFVETDNGRRGMSAAETCHPDVIILELLLPDMDGLEVLEALRRSTRSPVLVLSLCDNEADTVAALNNGASDFMTKPFCEAELLARLRVLQRCFPGESYEPILAADGLRVDLARQLVALDGGTIDLTPTEAALLHALLSQAGKVVAGRQLLKSVWGAEGEHLGDCLRVFISGLRKKLGHKKPRHLIETVGNLGYRLRLERTASSLPHLEPNRSGWRES